MTKHWLYLKYVLRHKWFVFLAGMKLGPPRPMQWPLWILRLIIHDWTKFLPSEWTPYVEYFYGEKVQHPTKRHLVGNTFEPLMIHRTEVANAFDVAWNYHQKRNDHHWQFWLLTPDKPRPNFNQQSYDGGMTHAYFRSTEKDRARDAAIAYDDTVDWWKPDYEAIEDMDADLRHVTVALPMPALARREMIADWRGAGRAQGKPDTRAWYLSHRENVKLHPETRAFVEQILNAATVLEATRSAGEKSV